MRQTLHRFKLPVPSIWVQQELTADAINLEDMFLKSQCCTMAEELLAQLRLVDVQSSIEGINLTVLEGCYKDRDWLWCQC